MANAEAAQPLAERLGALLLIRPGEGRRTALLFSHLLLASAIFILGRTVRDTLFLSRYPVDALPWMFVLYGVASAITVVIYGRFADKLARHTMIGASAVIGVVTYLGVWVAVMAEIDVVYPVFYVWSEVFANLFIVQFWTLANDLHDARSSKRLFGTIGAARVLGVVLIGVTAGVLVRAIGTAQLLFLLAAMMIGAAAIARSLRSEARPSTEVLGRRPREAPPVARDPYVRVLAVMILFCFTALTVGDYQFKVIARSAYREDALAQFFSLFYAGTGIISFLFQLFVTPRLLSRLGVGWGMTVMPSVFGASSAMLLVFPQLAVATAMKFADNGFQYTIHETTLQSLYVPFEASTKARTRALLDAVIKPCSYGMGGLVLIFAAPRMSVDQLSIITTALVVLWLVIVPIVKRRYVRSLQATLSAHGALALEEPELVLDASARQAIAQILQGGTKQRTLVALEQVDAKKMPEVVPMVEALTESPHPEVRALALDALEDAKNVSVSRLRARLADESADVRARAVRRYAAVVRDESVELLEPLIEDDSRKVRVEVVASLMRLGGIDGAVLAGARLAELLHGKAKQRVEAARVLGHLGTAAFRPLLRLLDDEKAKVRRASLKACQGVADPRLVEPLIAHLFDPACRVPASAGLIAIGEPAVHHLVELLQNPERPRAVRLQVPRILQRIPCKLSYEVTRDAVELDDSSVRLRVYAALSRLREETGAPPEPVERIVALVRMEIRNGLEALVGWEALREHTRDPLLEELAQLRYQRSAERVIRILELRYDRASVRLARHRVRSSQHRANALEVLDTLIEPVLRPLVMPFIDASLAVPERLEAAGDLAPAPLSLEANLEQSMAHPNPYIVMTLLHAMSEQRDLMREALVVGALGHTSPLVREEAIATVVRALHERAGELIAPLLEDSDAVVREVAADALDETEEIEMPTTIEKVLLLQSAPLFTGVPGEDLVPLARVADEVTVAADEVLFNTGDHGSDLFIIVSGRILIRRGGEPIATLGPGETFGEMAVLDEEPRSASAVAEVDSVLLRIGSEEFYESLHEQVEIAEGVIRMLTRRLRNATGAIGGAEKSSVIPASAVAALRDT